MREMALFFANNQVLLTRGIIFRVSLERRMMLL